MKLQIKTLSPIHIGNGEKYNGLSYIQDKTASPHRLYYISFETIKKVFTSQQLQAFSDWLIEQRFPSLDRFLREKLNDKARTIMNQLTSQAAYRTDQLFIEDFQQKRLLGV